MRCDSPDRIYDGDGASDHSQTDSQLRLEDDTTLILLIYVKG